MKMEPGIPLQLQIRKCVVEDRERKSGKREMAERAKVTH